MRASLLTGLHPVNLAGLLLAVFAAPSFAQHEDHAVSPYAHTQSLDFPTLTPQEVAELRNGDGMGLARPAELNRFPGPLHVLELASELVLDEGQVRDITATRDAMRAAAIAKGLEILDAERHLGELFSGGRPTVQRVRQITDHLGRMRGELRAIHLEAHLEVTRRLTSEQIVTYHRLRGYAG